MFQDNLYEAKASQNVKDRSTKEKVKVYCLRILAWFITMYHISNVSVTVYLILMVLFWQHNLSLSVVVFMLYFCFCS